MRRMRIAGAASSSFACGMLLRFKGWASLISGTSTPASARQLPLHCSLGRSHNRVNRHARGSPP